MAESYSVEAILSAKDTNFKSTFDEAQSSVSGLQKSADGMTKQGGFLSNVKSVATGMGLFKVASAGVSMISNGIGTLKDEMTESNIAWQTFGGNMGMLGKSEQEIGKVQKSLQQFATETIYGASDMATTYAQMAALGTDNTEQLVKGMGGLAASAENPQQAMKTLSQQMVQALAKPEMQWQDFKLMMEQAPSAMAQVAKHMGMSLDELILSIQDGEVASKDFANAVAEVGTNAQFSELATTYKSTGQAIDGLTETVANKLMPAFQAVDKFGIKAVEGLTNWIDNIDIDGAVGLFDEFKQAFTGESGEGGIAVGVRQQAETIKMSMEEIQGLADGWNGMTLAEKQAQVETMGQEDLDTLLTKLGVDFESLPNEYHKNAYLNAHGASALEEVLFLTGEWANLTIEEKRAVLEAQIDNEGLEEVIEQRGLWNDEEFITQLAEINMNDDDALQQVTDLINKWGEAEGLDPIKLKVDGKGVRPGIQAIADLVKAGQQAAKDFFKPMSQGFEEIGQAVSNFGSGLQETFRLIGQGDWSRAWDRFKNSTMQTFSSITDSVKTMFSGMWDNIQSAWPRVLDTISSGWDIFKTGFDGALDWFNNIDWASTWQGVSDWAGGVLDDIGEMVAKIDWEVVVGEITGTIGDIVSAVKGWVKDNIPIIEEGIDLLLDPTSDINIEAKNFTGEVNKLIGQAVSELALEVFDIEIDINPEGNIDWDSMLNKIRKDAPNWTLNDIMPSFGGDDWKWDWDLGEAFEIDVETGARVYIDRVRIEGMNTAELQNEATKLGLIEFDADGNVNFTPNFRIPPDTNIDVQALADQIADTLGIPRVQLEVELEVAMEMVKELSGLGHTVSEIQTLIDLEFGDNYFETYIKPELIVQAQVMRDQGTSEADIQQAIDAIYGDGAYETYVEAMVIAEISDMVAEGVTEADIKAYIDSIFGEGTYESHVDATVVALINSMREEGLTRHDIEEKIDAIFGEGTYETIVNTIIEPQVGGVKMPPGGGTSGFGAGPMISSAIESSIDDIPVNVPILPNLIPGSGMSGPVNDGGISSLVASMIPKTPVDMTIPINPILGGSGTTVEGGTGFDISGISAQIQSQLSALQTAVNTAMGNINSTILTQASLWSTSVATAMTSMSTAVTSAMTSMTASVLAGMTAMSVAVVASLTAMTVSVGLAMTLMSTTVTTTMTTMASNVASAMETMAESVTSAIDAMVQGITEGMANAVSAVESAVSSIIGAVDGLYDPMYSAGQSAGQGLADGLNSMQSAVSSAASALASAANQAAAAAFIINSPSKVWRGFGYSAGEGLVDGLDGSTRAVTRSATSLATAGLPTTRIRATLPSTKVATGYRGQQSQLGDMGSINLLREIKNSIDNGQVIMLDGKQVVGGTAGYMDQALGNISNLGGRHVLA